MEIPAPLLAVVINVVTTVVTALVLFALGWGRVNAVIDEHKRHTLASEKDFLDRISKLERAIDDSKRDRESDYRIIKNDIAEHKAVVQQGFTDIQVVFAKIETKLEFYFSEKKK